MDPATQALAGAVLSVILAQPVHGSDAGMTAEARERMLRPIAAAVAIASDGSTELAGALVSLGYAESGWAGYVLRDQCKAGPRGARCDNGRARGPWQVWSWCSEAWDHPTLSREGAIGGARCAVRRLRGGLGECSGSWAGAFARYGGAQCGAAWAPARERGLRLAQSRILASLAAAQRGEADGGTGGAAARGRQ